MHGGPHKRPKLAENDLRAPLLPCAPNGPVVHLQATTPAAHEQGAVPAGGCRCARHARLAKEWDEQRWLDWPIGVDEMLCLARGPSGPAAAAPRFHATFAGGVHLGCFATATEAADAWDAEARRRGQRVLNSPRGSSGEVSAAGHLRAVLEALPSHALPPLPSDQAWRSAELAALLAAARSPGGLNRMWADNGGGSIGGFVGGSVVQHDHCSAAGVQLCWSYNVHAWGVRKARSCAEGWQDTKPLPSVQEAWAARPAFRARCVRALLELDGCEMARGGGEARRGAARSFRDQDARPDAHAQSHAHARGFAPRLRQRACIFSGSWVLNFQPLVAAALLDRYGAKGATVLDPCGGWGGRLLGAVAVGAARYIACEPCVPTHAALCAMAAQVAATATGAAPGTVCELHRLGFEDLALPPCSVDVALTSPPYFNLELYDDAPSQSHVRYATPAQWEAHFLRRVFERVHAALKPGRVFLINVASNRMLREGGCDLEAAAHRCAAAAGFVPEPPIRMLKPAHGLAAAEQGSVSGEAEGGGDATSGKFEPVFVFRKPRPAVPQLGAAAPQAVAVASWPTAGADCGPDEDSARLDALLDGL